MHCLSVWRSRSCCHLAGTCSRPIASFNPAMPKLFRQLRQPNGVKLTPHISSSRIKIPKAINIHVFGTPDSMDSSPIVRWLRCKHIWWIVHFVDKIMPLGTKTGHLVLINFWYGCKIFDTLLPPGEGVMSDYSCRQSSVFIRSLAHKFRTSWPIEARFEAGDS